MNPHQLLYPLLNAKKRRYPFSHLYIESFFPERFYVELVKEFPSEEMFKKLVDAKAVVSGYSEKRGVLPLTEESVKTLHPVWSEMHTLLLGGRFGEAVLAFFHDEVEEVLRGHQLKQSLELVFDTSGYKLDVHTDHPNKVVTLIFYLPEDDALKSAGTALFAPKRELPSSEEYQMYPYDYFDLVATMPFVPNAVFGFARSDSSWHGVMPIEKAGIKRKSLCYRISMIP